VDNKTLSAVSKRPEAVGAINESQKVLVTEQKLGGIAKAKVSKPVL